jgi:hypothetical protein
MMLWTKNDPTIEAFPPEKASLSYGLIDQDSPFHSRNFAMIQKAIQEGYKPKPSDCPPLRWTSQYGFIVRSPGKVSIRRSGIESPEKVISDSYSRYRDIEISGDKLSQSDSGFIASWITGADYFKIQTNLSLLFPTHYHLMQGPPPNSILASEVKLKNVMLGVEYGSAQRILTIGGIEYFKTELNFIAPIPHHKEIIELEKGDIIGWFIPVMKKKDLILKELQLEHFS